MHTATTYLESLLFFFLLFFCSLPLGLYSDFAEFAAEGVTDVHKDDPRFCGWIFPANPTETKGNSPQA